MGGTSFTTTEVMKFEWKRKKRKKKKKKKEKQYRNVSSLEIILTCSQINTEQVLYRQQCICAESNGK